MERGLKGLGDTSASLIAKHDDVRGRFLALLMTTEIDQTLLELQSGV